MERKKIKVETLKVNPKNPREIKGEKFRKLCRSIKEFPEMMEKRPMVCVTDEDGKIYPLGGNMRLRAIQESKRKEIPASWVEMADDWSEKQRREFTIKDNVAFGEWDWDDLANDWDVEDLEAWGLDVPAVSETEKLSALMFEDIYYEPEEKPEITLENCFDMEKFNAKIEAIEKSKLSEDKKRTLKTFAYRFIKIDFESVANYYFFNASEEEQELMRRLRLVLCDSGIDGFIEDDLLKIHNVIEGWDD